MKKLLFIVLMLCSVFAASAQIVSWKNPLHLYDRSYIPFRGSLPGVENIFSVGSNDNVQNNPGLIVTSNHFVGSALDFKIVQNGASKWSVGQLNQFRLSGSGTGGIIYGQFNSTVNRGLTGTGNLYGSYFSVNIEGNVTTEAVGIDNGIFKGSAITANKVIGFRTQAANAYTNADEVTAGDFWTRTINPGFATTTTLGRSIWARVSTVANNGITTYRAVDISGFSVAGAIGTASAVYIGSDTAVGSTNYAIQSDSTAQSYVLGNFTVGGSAKFYITTPETPASATAPCTVGQFAWDSNFEYRCIATNTWKRAALSTW